MTLNHTSDEYVHPHLYGVASISTLLKILGLFCRISFLVQGSFAKETYNFQKPTNRSQPISYHLSRMCTCQMIHWSHHIFFLVAFHHTSVEGVSPHTLSRIPESNMQPLTESSIKRVE